MATDQRFDMGVPPVSGADSGVFPAPRLHRPNGHGRLVRDMQRRARF